MAEKPAGRGGADVCGREGGVARGGLAELLTPSYADGRLRGDWKACCGCCGFW